MEKFLCLINSSSLDICVISYNSRGFGIEKQEFCKYLVSEQFSGNRIPILCNQENFILKGNCYKILKSIPGFSFIIKPAVKQAQDKGRAKNGMFIAFPDPIKSQIEDVSPTFWRIQAAILKSSNSNLLIINSYFPVDSRNDGGELLETIEAIKHVIEQNEFSNILWLGDINCDFLRQTAHVTQVQNFIEETTLLKSWSKFEVDFTMCHEIQGRIITSTIDHFFWNEGLESKIIDAGVFHTPDNLSDHSPIYCVIRDGNDSITRTEDFHTGGQPKPCWKKASHQERESFKLSLGNQLNDITIPQSVLTCRDVHCQDTSHFDDVDCLTVNVLEAVQSCAFETLPVSQPPRKGFKRKSKPGWTEHVQPFRENSLFWHQVWKSAGRTVNTILHKIMKKTRNVYQLKKIMKSEELIKKVKLLDPCLNGDGEIFKEIKKMRNCHPPVAASMDGKKNNIANHFKDIYSELYNSVDDMENLFELKNDLENRINFSQLSEVSKVTPDIVKQAAGNLKDNKSDPTYSYSSDCFKHAPDKLFQLLSISIQSYLIHGHMTTFLLLATLIPLIKDKMASINQSKNYRSIAISSLVLKMIDWIILSLYGSSLGLDELQYAYQAGCSTTMCSWMVVETISYFMRNGSEIFTCCMDMTKAFDLVQHSLLFKKLVSAGLPTIFIRLLLVIYINQFANVKWNNVYSDMFTLRNGVRQGGVLSAILYCIYVNGLFTELRQSGYGCLLNGNYPGIFGYPDDNKLVSE